MAKSTTDKTFVPLPAYPDHADIEHEVLAWWETERIFEELRDRNSGGPRFSFIDGPVTANKTLGVHTAWGRTLKDVFQRYKAMRGFSQRYQNGYDCQGLWIEVEVEKRLGLNSKPDIEAYGLEKFAAECRKLVKWSAEELTKGSQRLGYWMDWGNDYFTFSDTNIAYIWRFLKMAHSQGWLYLGHRSTEWCPRCGTSLSQHELSQSGVYQERSDPSLFVRLPLLDRPHQSLVIWTTTPWTLPANVAAAVDPEAEYGRRSNGEWVATARYPDDNYAERLAGADLVGLKYQGPFDTLEPGSAVDHQVIPWDAVELTQGTGIVHIAPGAGEEDFELGTSFGLPVLTPVDGAGRFYPEYGWLESLTTTEAAQPIIDDLAGRGLLVESGTYLHSYPHCWRCDTPLIFRVADDWFISVDELRPRLLEANSQISWTPAYMGKRMDDWLRNMGDWNISRRRYYGLPLPIYLCSRGHTTVVGGREELEERAISGLDQLVELHRPWIDRVTIACEECSDPVERIPEVGDVWLDAGIVPFSTLGWKNGSRVAGGYSTGAAAGLSGADLPDHTYWEQWFPADWVSEMSEQIRLWFYSQLFMSVALVGEPPFRSVLGYEKMLDEHGKEMHGSWGNLIPAEEAFARMGADIMRWQYCAQPPDRNLLFGFGPGETIRRKLLTTWNSAKFLVDYANIEGFRPRFEDLENGLEDVPLAPLDRWLGARTQQLITEATEALDATLTHRLIGAFDRFIGDLSNWYIRRSRRRFYTLDEAAFRSLWTSLAQALRTISPVMPFITEHLWANLVVRPCPDAPKSIFLAPWPQPNPQFEDPQLLEEMADARRIVELGRQARSEARIKLRQPLSRAMVRGAPGGRNHSQEIQDELRVKEVIFDDGPVSEVIIKPNYPVLGPRLGDKVQAVAKALDAGEYEELRGGGVRVLEEVLDAADVVRSERVAPEGWAVAHEGELSVAIDTRVDADLLREGQALDLIRRLNEMRKRQDLDLTDRIRVTLPQSYQELVEIHGTWIAGEVLAVELKVDETEQIQIELAATD